LRGRCRRAAATAGPVAQGSVGAGAGAKAGRLKGGIGSASVALHTGHTVAALVAANPAGEVIDPGTGLPWYAGNFGLATPDPDEVRAAAAAAPARDQLNTTIGVVATDAMLDKAQCRRLAMVAHDGIARAVRPAHSLLDGDTVFVLATGAVARRPDTGVLDALSAAAADVVATAVVRAVLAATSVAGVPAYRDYYPSALAGH